MKYKDKKGLSASSRQSSGSRVHKIGDGELKKPVKRGIFQTFRLHIFLVNFYAI
jgi:hypothetical protein